MESSSCILHKLPYKHYCILCKANICEICKKEKHSGIGHKIIELKVEVGSAPECMIQFNGTNFDLNKEEVNISTFLSSFLWI